MCAERVKRCGSDLKKERKRNESRGEAVLRLEDEGRELGAGEGEPLVRKGFSLYPFHKSGFIN